MSMSESDREKHTGGHNFPPLSLHGQKIPDDFNDEDMAFSQELDTFFSLDEENLPPYFVQTLLEPEDTRFQPAERGFEHKTRARVFHRLKLHRRLFSSSLPFVGAISGAIPARRSLVTAGAALLLFMLLSVILTGPSFASGMQLLLRGTRTGVMQVNSYPSRLTSPSKTGKGDANSQRKHISLLRAQQLLHFPMYWPGAIPDNYSLENLYIYQEPSQKWADGPFFELDYAYSRPGATPRGTGLLAIREFKLKEDVSVLQVVKNGAVESIKIDQNGQPQAIYVDGQWVMHNKTFPTWVYGQRSELIYQRDGIVFWIVGDQRDGINKDVLLNTASSLHVLNINHGMRDSFDSYSNAVTPLEGDINGPFTGDIIAVFPDDSAVDPYLIVVGSDPSPPEKPNPHPKSELHLH